MNTYRVAFRRSLSPRLFVYDVDASKPSTAITRALDKLETRCPEVDVTCRLFARDIKRDWSDPKIREVAS